MLALQSALQNIDSVYCVYLCITTGFVIDFIPFPVINGFTSAAAITIALGQVKVS